MTAPQPNFRIAHLIKGLGRGGAERLLAGSIPCHGAAYHFTVVYFIPTKDHLVEELERSGAKVILVRSRGIPGMLWNLPLLLRVLRENRIDLIHAHLPWSGIVARLAGSWLGMPVVYTEHNLFSRYKPLTRVFSRLTYRMQRQVIAVSHQAGDVLSSVFGARINLRVISNGVDTDRFDPSGYDRQALSSEKGLAVGKLVVGVVSTFTLQKRLDRWLAIAGEVCRASTDIRFVLVGHGPLQHELLAAGNDLIRSGRLVLAGMTDAPAAWMACFDVFLMSSDYEGMPVALLEAMSMGCVPVATPVGGVPEVIADGENGILYDAADPSAAARAIISLAGSAAELRRLSAAARATVVQRYNIRRMVEELESVYLYMLEPPVEHTEEKRNGTAAGN